MLRNRKPVTIQPRTYEVLLKLIENAGRTVTREELTPEPFGCRARIPMYSQSPKAKRLEFRPPDPSCNAYLAFSAMLILMAGLDGIQNQIDPGPPLDKDIYDMSPEELKNVASMPGSLEESLQAQEGDYDFLLANEVFSEGLVERWIEYKRGHEINPIRMRPHPIEFSMYFDA